MKRSYRRFVKDALFISIIAVLGFLAYLNSINGEFMWDDDNLIRENPGIRDFSNLPEVFTHSIRGGLEDRENCSFRPLQTLSYMLDYKVWGLNPKGYHISSILTHIAAALAVYFLINLLYDNKLLSFFTGILFVLHPVQTEAVAYISGRADPLAGLFMLLCLITYIRWVRTDRNIYLILSISACILALISRESSIILPALILLYHYSFKEKLRWQGLLTITVLSAVYIILRLTLLKVLSPHLLSTTPALERIPGFFAAITYYARILILPIGLHMEYGNRIFHLAHPAVLSGVVIAISLLMLAAVRRNRGGVVTFSISWFFLTLLPQSNIYPAGAFMAEHWLYMPLIGFSLIIAGGLEHLYRVRGLKPAAMSLLIIISLSYFYLTVRQNRYWQNPLSFYEMTLRYAPQSVKAHNNLGLIYDKMGEHNKAMEMYKQAIELDPKYKKAYYNLGFAYQGMDRPMDAIAYYKLAIEIDPGYAPAYNNLGTVYSSLARHSEAIEAYKKALSLDAGYADAYNNLGSAYYDTRKYEEAIRYFKKALKEKSDNPKTYYNLAAAYYGQGSLGLALEYCEKAVERRYEPAFKFLKRLKMQH